MTTLDAEPVATVLARIHAQAAPLDRAAAARVDAREASTGRRLTAAERETVHGDAPPLAIAPATGRLLHLLAVSRRSPYIVEFGSSHGISTIYLAAAARDAGGRVVATELRPGKAAVAQRNLRDAHLDDLVDLRVGDALQTLRDLTGPVDLLVLDGANDRYLEVLALVEPALPPHALVVADLSRDDPDHAVYVDLLSQQSSGYATTVVPVDAGVAISVRTGGRAR